ncbi:uncharacterized protein G2W53_010109 [Senna tora]|uniref:Uncharacterized protein n=1 Tax=Senna tora TaxID=362788 RepID=A0A834WYP2_9FABA|nr:uncharacterized protein G2W53_010109 [Senna tora]
MHDDHKYEAFRDARTISCRHALGITGRICRKSPPKTTTFPPKGKIPGFPVQFRSLSKMSSDRCIHVFSQTSAGLAIDTINCAISSYEVGPFEKVSNSLRFSWHLENSHDNTSHGRIILLPIFEEVDWPLPSACVKVTRNTSTEGLGLLAVLMGCRARFLELLAPFAEWLPVVAELVRPELLELVVGRFGMLGVDETKQIFILDVLSLHVECWSWRVVLWALFPLRMGRLWCVLHDDRLRSNDSQWLGHV